MLIPLIHIRKLDGTNSEITNKTFDAVMICNGHFWGQVKPNIPGMEKFKGVIVHSGDYRTFHPYVGKRVVIVGCSHSAGMYSYYNDIQLFSSKYLGVDPGSFDTGLIFTIAQYVRNTLSTVTTGCFPEFLPP